MTPDVESCGRGMYGDFGRYVWQAGLENFEKVTSEYIVELYNYSIDFIVNELGYREDLFGDYDTTLRTQYYGHHDTKIIERIGKSINGLFITMY